MRVTIAWLPMGITAIRWVLVVPVAVAAAQQMWALAFWLFVVAMLSDFFDGWAARTFKVSTPHGAVFDAYADGALVSGGLIGLAVAGIMPVGAVMLVLAAGALIGSRWFFWPKTLPWAGIWLLSAVACLFISWTAITWLFAAQAFGWSWWYVAVTFGLLVLLAVLKRGRIRSWAKGI